MGLFATLAASASSGTGDDDDNANAAVTKTSTLPTAVQLHASRRVDFLAGTIDGRPAPVLPASASPKRRFEVLSYQAVELSDASESPRGGDASEQPVRLLSQQQRDRQGRKHLRPNLGVWDCRLQDGAAGGELVDKLLGQVIPAASSTATLIFTVDLADPTSVYPALDAMKEAVLLRYGAADRAAASSGGTTRLSKLRSAKFGAAPESKGLPSPASAGTVEGRITLALCCAVPPPPAKDAPPKTFQERQAVSLVQYHLHKFASEVDCTLAFVRPNDDDAVLQSPEETEGASKQPGGSTGGAIPSMTVSKFASIVGRIAHGLDPVEEGSAKGESVADGIDEAREGDDPSQVSSATDIEQPPIHVPGGHDDDLIGSVLLRNASCPGVWDAAKDDLWQALPPPAGSADAEAGKAGGKNSAKDSDAAGGTAGDEAWLSKLVASVPAHGGGSADDTSTVRSPSPSVRTTRSKGGASAATGSSLSKAAVGKKKSSKASSKSKNDDPTSFFESLMNN